MQYRKAERLNRTFYGIETCSDDELKKEIWVLIVPFMELKRSSSRIPAKVRCVLIVPFMELKLWNR